MSIDYLIFIVVIILIAIISYFLFYSTPKKCLEMDEYYKSLFEKWKKTIWMLFLGLFLIAIPSIYCKINNIKAEASPLMFLISLGGFLLLVTYLYQPSLSFLKSNKGK